MFCIRQISHAGVVLERRFDPARTFAGQYCVASIMAPVVLNRNPEPSIAVTRRGGSVGFALGAPGNHGRAKASPLESDLRVESRYETMKRTRTCS